MHPEPEFKFFDPLYYKYRDLEKDLNPYPDKEHRFLYYKESQRLFPCSGYSDGGFSLTKSPVHYREGKFVRSIFHKNIVKKEKIEEAKELKRQDPVMFARVFTPYTASVTLMFTGLNKDENFYIDSLGAEVREVAIKTLINKKGMCGECGRLLDGSFCPGSHLHKSCSCGNVYTGDIVERGKEKCFRKCSFCRKDKCFSCLEKVDHACLDNVFICKECGMYEHPLEKMKDEKSNSIVYFIRSSFSNDVKIGFTTQFSKRMRSIKKESYLRIYDCEDFGKEERDAVNNSIITLIATIKGGEILEKIIHRHFKRKRVDGEWFSYGRTINNFIKDFPGAIEHRKSIDEIETCEICESPHETRRIGSASLCGFCVDKITNNKTKTFESSNLLQETFF